MHYGTRPLSNRTHRGDLRQRKLTFFFAVENVPPTDTDKQNLGYTRPLCAVSSLRQQFHALYKNISSLEIKPSCFRRPVCYKHNFTPKCPPQQSGPSSQFAKTPELTGFLQLGSENFSLSTWLLLGASLQALLAFFVRDKLCASLPAAFILSLRILNGLMIYYKITPNPYLKHIIPKKSAAIVPNKDGVLTSADQAKVNVLLLGAKSNRPFRAFEPGFFELFRHFSAMDA